ncbi:Metal-dependent hydrolase YbeY [Candidatus Chlamydia sanziniae]|uniref:Endoribonuclease YbeY n=1 Tax=Candidatus Chlamydia sanziniae TaxID=1806891 RepID=A0A1A9HW25_9CHLA|nr:Metal-dependent hydrolase YbeY [Candidatus Chlamydia sanziniae]
MTSINIYVSNRQKLVPIRVRSVRKLLTFLLDTLHIVTHQVFVYFLEDKALAHLHKKVFSDPSLTDTITLPIDIPGSSTYPHVLGEAFISPEAAIRFLKHRPHTKEDLYEEISRYLIHSTLHMLGYNDTTPKEKTKMRVKENQLLCMLRENDALLTA